MCYVYGCHVSGYKPIRQNASCIVCVCYTLCEVLQGGDMVFVCVGINIWNLTWYFNILGLIGVQTNDSLAKTQETV